MDVVRITDHVGPDSYVRGERFEDATIVGPAMLALDHDVTVRGCTLWMPGSDPTSVFIEVPVGQRIVGVVGLADVAFERCEFQNIAWIGTRNTLDLFRRDLFGVGWDERP